MQFHLAEMSQGENDYEKALQSLTSTIGNNICEGAKKAELLLSSACIFRVPDELLRLKESAYIPRLIAIGPLHQNDKHLQTPARDIKKSLTNSLLCRLTTGMPDESEDESYKSTVLQECVKEMRDCVDKARKCYAVELDLSDDHMLEMMLVDGCFILELLYGSFDESKYIPKEAKNIPKEEGQDGKRNGASTSSDLSTPLLQASGMTRMQSPLALQLETEVLRLESEIKISSGQKNTDPIWAANTVQHDLLLLENQIPFFVLEKLFRLTVDRIQNNRPRKLSLNDYVFHYFGNILSPEENSTSSGGTTAPTSRGSPGDSTVLRISLDDQMKSSEEDGVLTSNAQRYYHILHKLHEYCVPQTEQTREKGRIEIMPCASELDYASVKFEPVPGKDLFKAEFSDPEGPFRWCQTARFKIPVLEIYENTELLLRNLIAFEQCCPKVSQHFTSYAVLMDMLVNSGRDVQLLERAGVMRNHLGSRADATNLFNNLCKGVVLEEFFFADMCSKATAHSKRSWPKNLAHIRRTYLSSPWSFIAFCVAFIAFGIQIVTFIQSFL